MMREVLKLANTIEKDIQLTAEVPSEKKDKKLPVLDLKVWVREIKGEKLHICSPKEQSCVAPF